MTFSNTKNVSQNGFFVPFFHDFLPNPSTNPNETLNKATRIKKQKSKRTVDYCNINTVK